MSSASKIYTQKVVIPTYGVGNPNRNPMFLEKRVYQGSSGRVYPYPVIDKIYDEKKDVTYDAVILENEYLYVMILPCFGGRIQRAYDKTNGYDFVYHNEVIKPALVGLLGPWISGGIEFNWPQHHRPTTYMPVSYKLFENEDGSVTLATGDVDEMYGTRVVTRFTLHPGKAYIEIEGQLYNRTNHTQTFLWWANPAVAVNNDTQSVFPPDVTAVFDHGKRDVSSFPIAHGVYYKHDYSAGVDISRYKNIPVPTSYMAYKSSYDFVGGYDYARQAGILHIADHHISPGKKQWTWGCGDFGQAWDRNLTDANGPYIELMTGVYTDNQPDFTFLAPYEEKTFRQYFMPYKKAGYVKNANLDVIVNLTKEDGKAVIAVCPTSRYEKARISLCDRSGKTVFEEEADLTVETGYVKKIETPLSETELTLRVADSSGRTLIVCAPEPRKEEELPSPASSVESPEKVRTNEELVLIAQHLEQYRHATLESEPYYQEALRRDPLDSRANLFYGELLMKRCCLKEAEACFRASIKRSTWLTPNPYDSEAYFELGQVLVYQNRLDEAYDAFYKATWSERECGRSFYALAALASRRHDWAKAEYFIDRAVSYNTNNMKARDLMCLILAHLGRESEAVSLAEENLRHDPFDIISLSFLGMEPSEAAAGRSVNYIYPAWDLISWGEYERAQALLESLEADTPMKYYYLAYCACLAGVESKRKAFLAEAGDADETYSFPNTVEDFVVLSSALEADRDDVTANYLAGNLMYDKKNYSEAYSCWKKGERKNATVLRNLALVLYNKMDRGEEALEYLKKAFDKDRTDSRILLELVQLEEKLGISMAERRKLLEDNYAVMSERDDLFVLYISFLNRSGLHDEALRLLSSRIFHPWEGGEGKVTKEYIVACKDLALQAMKEGRHEEALLLLDKAMVYPHNLGEGKLEGCKDNEVHYLKGLCYEAEGCTAEAEKEFRLTLEGKAELSSAMYYYDQPADIIAFQALALEKLGEKDEARSRFESLIQYGNQHKDDEIGFDYFAVSLPDLQLWTDNLSLKNRAHCHYLCALGYACERKEKEAGESFRQALSINPDLADAERLQHVLDQIL